MLYGSDISKYGEAEPELEQAVERLPSSVSGWVANPGVVLGPVKVLKGINDNGKVRAGDIIVTTMTTPEYINAMEKAAAWVTDEGGITCHACIMAREFGVPVIVATQIATRIFHDNDIVRVDARTGLVEKL